MSVGAYGLASDQNKLESWSLAGIILPYPSISSLNYCLMSVGGYSLASEQNKLES
jgi:hypothetical protein